MSKKAYRCVIVLCIILIFTGIIIVNNSMPEFIKGKSKFSINCSLSPLDFKINTKNYSINFGRDNFNNFKDVPSWITEKTNNIISGIHETAESIKSDIAH